MNNEATDNLQSACDEASLKGAVRELQLLRAGSFHCGIFVDEIATIVAWREPTPLPHAPKSVLGIVSIQGRMLTVLELATLAGGDAHASEAARNNNRQIIALRGDEQLALVVDALGEVVKIADHDLSTETETANTLILGVLQLADSEINILSLKEVFPTALQGRQRRKRRF